MEYILSLPKSCFILNEKAPIIHLNKWCYRLFYSNTLEEK